MIIENRRELDTGCEQNSQWYCALDVNSFGCQSPDNAQDNDLQRLTV